MVTKPTLAWVRVTPLGRMELETVSLRKSDCWEYGRYRGSYFEYKASLKAEGHRVVRVEIRAVRP